MIDIFKGQIATSNSDDDHRQLFHWIGNWMSVVATILQDQCDFSDTTRDTLRSLKMIPTTDDSLVSLDEKTVFFPVTIEGGLLQKKKKGNKRCPTISCRIPVSPGS